MSSPQTSGDDPNDNVANLVYIPAAVFVGVCPILVALRIWARLRRGGKTGADDYMTVVSLVCTLLLSGMLVAACQHGMGRHWSTLSPEEKLQMLKFFYAAQIVYKAAINLVKCCIILLYLRIFNKIRWFRVSCWFLLAAVGCYCIASVLVTIFQCQPIDKFFYKNDPTVPGSCVDNVQFWYANAGFSIATDIVILLLPMPLVYKLQVAWPQKVALMAVFTLGIFVVITSCLRITSLDILATSPDTSYDIENVMWTIIEPNVAIVCACLPIIRPFIVKLIPMLRSKGYSSNPYAVDGSSYANKSRHTHGGGSQLRDENHWVEIGGAKSDNIHMSSIQRHDSTAGSEENILSGAHDAATTGTHNSTGGSSTTAGGRNSDGRDGGIQKTVEYSVQYSNKE